MTLDQLKKEQDGELAEYWEQRAIRSKELENSQQEMVNNCVAATPESRVLLKNVLLEHRQSWEEAEQEELDLIKYAHAYQKETLQKENLKKQAFMNLLNGHKDKNNYRGR